MTITREDLKTGRIRRLFAGGGKGPRPLTDQEFEDSIAGVLAARTHGGDVWVFGYGSLVWNPLFHYVERRRATLHGFHRRFCLWSVVGRGTPEAPGLVLGLDRGGCCHGVAYRLAAASAPEELRLLWCREMVTGAYVPRWLRARCDSGGFPALAFVVNRAHAGYAGRLPFETVVRAIAAASGLIGSSADYLRHTREGLARHGIRDPQLDAVHAAVAASAPAPVDPPLDPAVSPPDRAAERSCP
ncbi:MAG: gamma-glutamylcyclotransferase [Burkholderiales bacterium]|nr:gamma-glutamylcyclotransferase [Burkholderiales bacterium]